MQRHPRWSEALQQLVEQYEGIPFKYGENDCALFVGRAIHAMTGEDLFTPYLQKYSTEIGAKRLYCEQGLSNFITTILNLNPTKSGEPERGDICLFRFAGVEHLAVCLGMTCVLPTTNGLDYLRTEEVTHWWRT